MTINELAIDRGKRALETGALPGARPARFVFVAISGAHLYGFPSADSDIDLRGCHVLPPDEMLGLTDPEETYESTGGLIDGIEVDCVSHDIRKYLLLLTRKNGYVLEQIFSPLIVYDGGHLDELRALARGAMTRHVVHHYKGFFRTQEKLVLKDAQPTAKALLYLFRVAMTGLHLLRTGEVEANILKLNENFKLPFIADLVARKMSGKEKGRLQPEEFSGFLDHARVLEAQLDPAAESSTLPESVQNFSALNEFLLRLRRG
ncbi:MAG TPA: nucleotidyltransferase domain-containing protein [Planctomycetota bacterium]|nr:nucleotidyltransferase domain-containing protein [Planctomycetota bacterium]